METFFENNIYFKEKFQDKYMERNYEKNDVVSYRMGKEIPNKLVIVIQGLLLVETHFGQNSLPFYSFIGKNHIFGWEILDVRHTARAQEKTTVVEIDHDFFFDHVYVSSELYQLFLSNIVKDFFLLAESYQYVNKPPVVKLLNSLLNISNKMNLQPNNAGLIEFPNYITPTFISKYAHSSEPNISIAGGYLEKNKIIKRKPYRILDEPKARELLYKDNS